MINKVILIGNLGDKPEMRATQSGMSVCNFRIATNESWFDKESGTRKDKTEWHRIVVWGKQAENCERYLDKGRRVYVEGRLQTRQWEDREGVTKYTTEIVAQNVRFLGGRGDSPASSPSAPSGGGSGSDGGSKSGGDFYENDIPF